MSHVSSIPLFGCEEEKVPWGIPTRAVAIGGVDGADTVRTDLDGGSDAVDGELAGQAGLLPAGKVGGGGAGGLAGEHKTDVCPG